jgi:hypothetical protein
MATPALVQLRPSFPFVPSILCSVSSLVDSPLLYWKLSVIHKMDADPPVGPPASASASRSASPVSSEALAAMVGLQYEHMFKDLFNYYSSEVTKRDNVINVLGQELSSVKELITRQSSMPKMATPSTSATFNGRSPDVKDCLFPYTSSSQSLAATTEMTSTLDMPRTSSEVLHSSGR